MFHRTPKFPVHAANDKKRKAAADTDGGQQDDPAPGSGGTAGGYGTIFKLVPPAALGATWTEVILYSFTGTADSAGPSPIAFGPDGNLYGITVETTTLFGKILDYGTAFQLVLQ